MAKEKARYIYVLPINTTDFAIVDSLCHVFIITIFLILTFAVLAVCDCHLLKSLLDPFLLKKPCKSPLHVSSPALIDNIFLSLIE